MSKLRMLVLECNPQRLASEQNTRLGDRLVETAKHPAVPLTRRKIGAPEALQKFVRGTRHTFDGVVVIAHGNPVGLELGADSQLEWADFASMIAPLRPRSIVLASCYAGFEVTTAPFFQNMPELTSIYASPSSVCIDQTSAALLRCYAELLGAPNDQFQFTQLVDHFITGSSFIRRTRTEHAQQASSSRWLEDILLLMSAEHMRMRGGRRLQSAFG